MPPAASRLYDPAKDAARFLGWFGLAVLMVGAPLVNVLSRWALFVVLPVGAGILGAAYFLSLSKAGLRTLQTALLTPVGLAGIFLVGWAAVSLVWTPYPEEAAPRYVATLATAVIAALLIAHLPERRASRSLYLLPGGLALAALVTGGLALFGPVSFRGGTEFDPSLIERSAVTLTLLVWPALGALGFFGRWRWSIGLAVLVAAALFSAGAQLALAVFALGATAFALTTEFPRRVSFFLAATLIALMLVAPLLPFALAPLARAIPAIGRSTVAAMTDWRAFIANEPIRLITGHGLDAARHGVQNGYLPPHTPRSILFEVWYDLGVLGALAFAGAFALGMLAASRAAATVAPSLLAGLTTTVAITLFGVATAELWYVTLVSVQSVALGLLARSSRSHRPVLGPLDSEAH